EDVRGILLPAIVDRGGLVIHTANPPKDARGEWVTELVEKAKTGVDNARVFTFDPKLNPHVDRTVLASLRRKLDERTYRREIPGEFLANPDVVFYAFSMVHNVAPVGMLPTGEGRFVELVDVTKE